MESMQPHQKKAKTTTKSTTPFNFRLHETLASVLADNTEGLPNELLTMIWNDGATRQKLTKMALDVRHTNPKYIANDADSYVAFMGGSGDGPMESDLALVRIKDLKPAWLATLIVAYVNTVSTVAEPKTVVDARVKLSGMIRDETVNVVVDDDELNRLYLQASNDGKVSGMGGIMINFEEPESIQTLWEDVIKGINWNSNEGEALLRKMHDELGLLAAETFEDCEDDSDDEDEDEDEDKDEDEDDDEDEDEDKPKKSLDKKFSTHRDVVEEAVQEKLGNECELLDSYWLAKMVNKASFDNQFVKTMSKPIATVRIDLEGF